MDTMMLDAILASGSELVTLAMRRVDLRGGGDALLPNTSGAKTADEALFAARLAREALGTYWIKLALHPDMQYLLPRFGALPSAGGGGLRRGDAAGIAYQL